MPDSSPIWDLTDLYSTIEDAAITADIEASRKAAKSLAADWRGRLGEADGPQLATLIAEYERILETLPRKLCAAGFGAFCPLAKVRRALSKDLDTSW